VAIDKRLYANGKVAWRVRVFQGRHVVDTRTFPTLREAKAFDANRREAVRNPDWISPSAGKIPFDLVAQEWLTTRRNMAARTLDTDRDNYRRHLQPTFGAKYISSISAGDVDQWLGELAGRNVPPASRRRALSVLRGILNYAIASRRIVSSPAASTKLPKGGSRREGRALSSDELARLLNEIDAPYRPVVLALATMGLRFSELSALTCGDVIQAIPRGYVVRIHRARTQRNGGGAPVMGDTKGHRSRPVPVPGVLKGWLQKRVEEGPVTAPLFPAPKGGHWTNTNFRNRTNWTTTVSRANLAGLKLHDLRHSAGSALLVASRGDLLAVSRILGHSSPTVTGAIYSHLLDGQIFDAMDGLAVPGLSQNEVITEDNLGTASEK
jgi:integrase